MPRQVTRCLLALCLATALTLPAVAAESPESVQSAALASDPRVVDAVNAWKEWLEYQAGIDSIPAVSVGVVHDQELIATDAFGLANPETRLPATPQTLYSICSISKLFTSVAVMQQRDAGKLRLDDPVAQHLSWFDIDDVHPEDGPITIRGLLTHSSGPVSYTHLTLPTN